MQIRPIIPAMIIVALLPSQALADGGIIDIGQAFSSVIAPYINAAVQGLIAAGVVWVMAKIKQKTGIDIDAGHRDALTRALQNQASSLIAEGVTYLDSRGKIVVGNNAMANAVNDLMQSVPDAVKHFGLTPEFVRDRIIDMIPQVTSIKPNSISIPQQSADFKK